MSDTDRWKNRLRDAFNSACKANRPIKLPTKSITFSGKTDDHVTIHMESKAVVGNMQTDVSAFEAWSLALRAWCGVKSVVLTWEPPKDSIEDLKRQIGDEKKAKLEWDKRERHYQRFLYRAQRFSELFVDDWFLLEGSTEAARALADGANLVVNIERKRKPADEGRLTGETALERKLVKSEEFHRHFGLDACPRRQVPVGLFEKEVKRGENQIFAGGSSMIDLVGTSGTTLVLFELKAQKERMNKVTNEVEVAYNTPAGILSELFFYACVMRDLLPGPNGRKPRFVFKESSEVGIDVQRLKRIKAVLLAPRFHPLIGHPTMLEPLNAALRKHSTTGDQVPMEIAATTLIMPARDGEAYRFEDMKLRT